MYEGSPEETSAMYEAAGAEEGEVDGCPDIGVFGGAELDEAMAEDAGGEGDASAGDALGWPRPGSADGLVLLCEQRAEEWHFDDDARRARLEQLRQVCDEYRAREARAREREQAAHDEFDRRATEALSVAHALDTKAGAEVSDMRTEMQEVEARTERTLEDCRREVARLEALMATERAGRKEAEEELRQTREKAKAATSTVEQIQDQEAEAGRERDRRLAAGRDQTRKKIDRIQREAEARVKQIDERVKAEVAALQAEAAEVMARARNELAEDVRARREQIRAADRDARNIDDQVRAHLQAARTSALERREENAQKVRESQARDREIEHLRINTAKAACMALDCAAEETQKAANRERDHRRRADGAVQALGSTFPRSTQYGLHFDARARSALRASAEAMLSARSESATPALSLPPLTPVQVSPMAAQPEASELPALAAEEPPNGCKTQ